jgi:hypothetical protein
VQNIETGGNNKTSTPMLKFLIKRALFEPERTALHIEHWAAAGEYVSKITPIAKAINSSVRNPLV